ncbi:hypothetical protein B0H15DRAFT_805155 [Mycena belliarum]|uniref:Uncharacterized protein n=1 Tax=Mycena belliarum TaxID=1033014 RepID=A0AAD6XL02_9AGAR|nr:hypothetical protein B0H15DRAFT_805155 [Mycena belliae]
MASPSKKAAKRAAKGRRNRKNVGKKPGKDSWVNGTKLAFFEHYKQRWEAAGDNPGPFYSEMVKRFILKYGWESCYSERGYDLDTDTPDPTDEDLEGLVSPEDEVEDRTEYYYHLRSKIGQWYRYHYKKLLASNSLESNVDALLAGMTGGSKPRRGRALHLYSKLHYEKRVKEAFTKEFDRLTQDFEDGELDNAPKELATRNRITKECYDAESDAFRERIEAQVDKNHAEALAEWDEAQEALAGGGDARTPQEFHDLLTSAAATIDPVAAGIAARYGMVCSIFIAGPVPGKGGMIEVMSSNSGTTLGRAPKTWPEFDGPGFSGVVTSMHCFATLAFTQDQCDVRCLPGVPLAGASNVWVTNGASTGGPRTLTTGVFTGLGRGGANRRESEDEDNEDNADEDEDEEDDEEDEVPLAVRSKSKKGKGAAGKGKEKEKHGKGKGKDSGKGKGKENRKKSAAKKAKEAATGPLPQRPKPKPRGAAAIAAVAAAAASNASAQPSSAANTTTADPNESAPPSSPPAFRASSPPPSSPPAFTASGAFDAPASSARENDSAPPSSPPAFRASSAPPSSPPVLTASGALDAPASGDGQNDSAPPSSPPAFPVSGAPPSASEAAVINAPASGDGQNDSAPPSSPPAFPMSGAAPSASEAAVINAPASGDGRNDSAPPSSPPATFPASDAPDAPSGGDDPLQKELSPPAPWPTVAQSRWQDELRRIWPHLEAVGLSWGEVWEDCAFAFLAFEEASGFPYERLWMAKPPRAGLGVDNWIASGRRLWAPCLDPPSELRPRFWKWWRGMQPEVRRIGDGVMSREANVDWSVLRDFSRKNGLLQVVMVLLWWGELAHAATDKSPRDGEQVAEWESAVEDVTWALTEMVKEGRLSKKRAVERGVTDKAAPTAKKVRWSM